jgi:hypothetical protein
MEHLRFSSEPHAGPEEVAFVREALAWHNVAATRDFYFGMVSEWEEWTRMRFLESGLYVVPGAQPVEMELERDKGRYEDPNVWMRHPVS